MYILYLITCTVTGVQYVGKTAHGLEQRWKQHQKDAKRNSRSYLHEAIRKYGAEAFKIEQLPHYPQDERSLNEWEKFLISVLRQCGKLYNLTDGGDGISGWKHSSETKKGCLNL